MDLITDEFQCALRDYAYLINQSYLKKDILKLVGDRYQLTRMQRLLLNRGIFRQTDIDVRNRKRVSVISEAKIYVDALNVLFTIGNYLLGRQVFVSNDGFLRDGGEITGKLHQDESFIRAADLLMIYLSNYREKEYIFLIDEPVQGSIEVQSMLNSKIIEHHLKGTAYTVTDPDIELIKMSEGLIATSDSEVIEQSDTRVIDLAYEVLTHNFQPDFINLAKKSGFSRKSTFSIFFVQINSLVIVTITSSGILKRVNLFIFQMILPTRYTLLHRERSRYSIIPNPERKLLRTCFLKEIYSENWQFWGRKGEKILHSRHRIKLLFVS